MFGVKTRKKKTKKKKNVKKKQSYSINLLFLTGIKIILFCINFIKYVTLLQCKKKKKNLKLDLFRQLYLYLIYDKSNSVTKIKFQIYKHKLMQLQS
jgi:hypothetical protein